MAIKLTEALVDAFQRFVEWILDMQFTPQQSADLCNSMIQEWNKDERQSKELVIDSLNIYDGILKSVPSSQGSYRQQNQSRFIARLRQDLPHNEFARSIIDAYDTHSFSTANANPKGTIASAGTIGSGITASAPLAATPSILAPGNSLMAAGERLCEKCKNYRDIMPVSTLLAKVLPTNDAPVGNALTKIREIEFEASSHELNELYIKDKIGRKESSVQWDLMPIMHPYCGLSEAQGMYLIFSIKNSSHDCKDFKEGSPVKKSCDTCSYRSTAKGPANDQLVESKLTERILAGVTTKSDTSALQGMLSKLHDTIPTNKATEISRAYSEGGLMTSEPKYLDHCRKYSVGGKFAVCVLQNHHQTCAGHSDYIGSISQGK